MSSIIISILQLNLINHTKSMQISTASFLTHVPKVYKQSVEYCDNSR